MARPDVGSLPETITTDPSQPGGRPDTVDADRPVPADSVDVDPSDDLSSAALTREAEQAAREAGPNSGVVTEDVRAASPDPETDALTERILNGTISAKDAMIEAGALSDDQRSNVLDSLRESARAETHLSERETHLSTFLSETVPASRELSSGDGAEGDVDVDGLRTRALDAVEDIQSRDPEMAGRIDASQKQSRAADFLSEVENDPERDQGRGRAGTDAGQKDDSQDTEARRNETDPAKKSMGDDLSLTQRMERQIEFTAAGAPQL